MVYLLASDSTGNREIYVPISSTENIDLTRMQSMRNLITDSHSDSLKNLDNVCFNLAIVDPSTTILYYSQKLDFLNLEKSNRTYI